METIEKRIEYIRDCHESFVESCGIRHHTFDDIWFYCPKYFLYQDSDSAKFLRRECLTLYLQFTNILEDCEKYNITNEDLEYRFHLNDMKEFINTYKSWVEEQFTKPNTIL